MNHARKIKKVLGVLIHLSEHRGRNLVSGDLAKNKFFHKKSEELKNLIIENWNRINELETKFRDFQKSLDHDREKLKKNLS